MFLVRCERLPNWRLTRKHTWKGIAFIHFTQWTHRNTSMPQLRAILKRPLFVDDRLGRFGVVDQEARKTLSVVMPSACGFSPWRPHGEGERQKRNVANTRMHFNKSTVSATRQPHALQVEMPEKIWPFNFEIPRRCGHYDNLENIVNAVSRAKRWQCRRQFDANFIIYCEVIY